MNIHDDDEDSDEFSRGDGSTKHAQRSGRIDRILAPFSSALSNFTQHNHGTNDDLLKLRESLEDGLKHRSHTCVICIENLKNEDAVWSCRSCFTVFHLYCIQSWARHGDDYTAEPNENEPPKEQCWNCPKCRQEYPKTNCPNEYRCYCGQVVNPKPDPWLLPHSCGQECRRPFSTCKHSCLLLCHPGSCPPCPQTVRSSCFCGKATATVRRCSASTWSCRTECGRFLNCGTHKCHRTCHEGPCDQCDVTKLRTCSCGRKTEKRPCGEKVFSCETVCGRKLACGKHFCEGVCHAGECQPCGGIGASSRTCGCGKTTYGASVDITCVDQLPSCGDTCDRYLSCGLHQCIARCHRGECPPCAVVCTKRCQCKAKAKETICGKPFTCESKCKRKRQCGKHLCNKKCCTGNCSPCEQQCGKVLKCGNHKCQQPCHRGLCYPCPLTVEIKCRCGKTRTKVPCGAEKRTKPPRCRERCAIPPICHHERRTEHPCHFDDCPACKQICDKPYTNCTHRCASSCHSAVWLNVNAEAAARPVATPLERVRPKFEFVNLPCPPCKYPVKKQCLGEHEIGEFPCCELRPYSCGKACGHPLACGNHYCSKLCHESKKDCEECEESCKFPRNKDCVHPCTSSCHPRPCKPCRQMIRKKCICGVNEKYVACKEWCLASEDERIKMLFCGNPCPKNISCGHRCTLTCHLGECSAPELCQRKVDIRCPCGRLKNKAICQNVQRGEASLRCDEECERIQKTKAAPVPEEKEHENQQQQPVSRRRKPKKYRTEEIDDSGIFAALKQKPALVAVASAVTIGVVGAVIVWLS